MKKFFTGLAALSLFVGIGAATSAWNGFSKLNSEQPQPVVIEAPEAYSPQFLTYKYWDPDWPSTDPQYGFYNVDLAADSETLVNRNTLSAYGSDVYDYMPMCWYNGEIYYIYSWDIKSFNNTYGAAVCRIDGDSFAANGNKYAEEGQSHVYGYDMTFDYTTGHAYAVANASHNSGKSRNGLMKNSVLNCIDLENATGTLVGEQTDLHLFTICADANGQLWALGKKRDSDLKILHTETYLFKVNKQNGSTEEVCQLSLPIDQTPASAMVCDFRSGKFYYVGRLMYSVWYDNEKYSATKAAVWEINPTSGEMTAVTTPREVVRGETNRKYMGLMIKDSHPKAPGPIEDLALNGGKVTFTVPSETYDRSSLSGPLTGQLTVDGGRAISLSNLNPGDTYTSGALSLAEGNHEIKVVLFKDELRSVDNVKNLYLGNDAPSPVTDITLTAVADDEVLVGWTPPTTGANGGEIDPAKLTYKIERLPEATVITESATGSSYTDKINRKMGKTGYRITPVYEGNAGASAVSGSIIAGTAHSIPYLEDFQTQAGWTNYTTIDANKDYSTEDGSGVWWWSYEAGWAMGAAAYISNVYYDADDWLITPALDLKEDHVYRLQFQTYGLNNGYTNRVQVCTGSAPTVEAMTEQLLDVSYTTAGQSKVETPEVLFTPKKGHNRIGFRNISKGSNPNPWGQDHMLIDNIYIIDYGTKDIPAAPTEVSGEYNAARANITLSFTLPTQTLAGDPLTALESVKIYRNDVSDPIATLTDVAPGKKMTYVDSDYKTGDNLYRIAAVSDKGAGMEASITVASLFDVPKQPTNVKVAPQGAYTVAEVTWTQDYTGVNGGQLSEFDVIYEIYRYVGVKRTLIEETWQGTTYVDRGIMQALSDNDMPGQGYVSYEIVPRTNGGKGSSAVSDEFLAGKSYQVPFTETWPYQGDMNAPWKFEGDVYPVATGYNYSTFVKPSDNDGGMREFKATSELISPRIDISSVDNATMTFYVFHSSDANANGAKIRAGFFNAANNTTYVTDVLVNDGSEGWKMHEAAVPAQFAACDDLQIIFRSEGASNNCAYLDQVSVTGERPDYEVRVEAIYAPNGLLIGSTNSVGVDVRNLGSKDNSNIKVTLEIDGVNLGEKTIESLASLSTTRVDFDYTPSLDHTEGVFGAVARISADNDGSAANNELTSSVSLVAPMLPVVNDLAVSMNYKDVQLDWSEPTAYPHIEYTTEDCEGLESFAIENMGGWNTIDVDGVKTALLSTDGTSAGVINWPNAGEPQAFIVFNTDKTGTSSYIFAHSGDQCFISMSANSGANDDWLISPQLSGEAQTISFYAKCLYPYNLEERFEVYASSTRGDETQYFTERLTPEQAVTVTSYNMWTRYSYDLPAGTRYFAIRCISEQQFGLMIDDITYSPALRNLDFYGYNVYRDGAKITPEEIGDNQFRDSNVEEGKTYRYNVTSVYSDGESIFSNPVSIKVDYSSVNGPAADADLRISAVQGGIRITGAAGLHVVVSDIEGRVMYDFKAAANDITLPAAPGLYVVATPARTAKLAVK